VTTRVPAIVIGAGISGLVCAHALRKRGVDALILEAAPRPGGVIQSERRDGFLLELGPQSFNATAPILNLCGELQIDKQLVEAPHGAPRYVLLNGKLQPVPSSPAAFFTSSIFNIATKWRIVRDLIGQSTPPDNDESLADFVRRKFSEELLEKLVGPFVSGIYAGDPEKLSLRSAFPQMYEAEKSSGSVVRGLLRDGKKEGASKDKSSLQTFCDGNQTLVDTLAAGLGSNLRCGVEAQSISVDSPDPSISGFQVMAKSGGHTDIIVAERLVVATSASRAGALLSGVDSRFQSALQGIEYAPVAVVSLGYNKSAVGHSLNGFGFLAPRSSGLKLLGTVWNSSLFPDRAPKGQVLLTSFIGGVTDTAGVSLPVEELVAIGHRELAQILNISKKPIVSHVQKYDAAIPQLNIGHDARMSELQKLCAKYSNLHLAGNYLGSPAIGPCIERALAIASETK
jgi:oxygen-dependent protoporphyrinogen oxidase